MKPMVFFDGLLQPSKLFLNDDFRIIPDWPRHKLKVLLNFDSVCLPQWILEVRRVEVLIADDSNASLRRFVNHLATLQIREGVKDARVGDLYFLLDEDDQ